MQLLRTVRAEPLLVGSVLAGVAVLTVIGEAMSSPLTVPYAIFVLGAGLFIAWVHGRHPLSRGVLWLLAAWGVMHMAGGVIRFDDGAVLYNVDLGLGPLRFDRLVHAMGFGTSAVAAYQVLFQIIGRPAGLVGASVLIGLGIGAINETVEFLMSQVADTNVGGFTNTGWDLVANVVGCLIAGALLARRRRAARV
jgi:uncharacterized membrane protein YjdF